MNPFLRGMARVLDLFGQLDDHPIASTEGEANAMDVAAMRSDWEAVGSDINEAISEYQNEPALRRAKP